MPVEQQRCGKCGRLLPASNFHLSTTRKSGLNHICKSCRRLESKTRYQTLKLNALWVVNNKRNVMRLQAARRKPVLSVKSAGCHRCGEKNLACLDLHHLTPCFKHANVSRLVNSLASPSQIEDELKKCLVLCANCHRTTHDRVGKHPNPQRTKIGAIKMRSRCAVCCLAPCPAALDLHHLEPLGKSASVSVLASRKCGWSLVVEELKKCVVLCANCHRKFHNGSVALGSQNLLTLIPSDLISPVKVYRPRSKVA